MMRNFCGSSGLAVMMSIFFMAAAAGRGNASNSNMIPVFDDDALRANTRVDDDEVVRMAGYGHEKLSTVLITGSLHCHPHFPATQPHPHAWPIPGATVAVNCHSHARERKGKSAVVARGGTDEFGDFIVDLPSQLHAIPNLEKVCTVKVDRMPKGTLCRPAHMKRHKQLRLSSFGNGIRTYSAGNIRLQHV